MGEMGCGIVMPARNSGYPPGVPWLCATEKLATKAPSVASYREDCHMSTFKAWVRMDLVTA